MTLEQLEIGPLDLTAGRHMVVIFNNETNTFDEVVVALVTATGCDVTEASIEAWEAHTFGSSSVHFAPLVECQSVANKIRSIGLKVEVRPEWND